MNKGFGLRRMDIAARQAMLERFESMTELPLLLLSFAMVPVLIGPLLWEDSFSDAEKTLFRTLDIFIWALFAADFALKFIITTDKLAFLRRNWLEALVVLVPFIRPLRIIRIILFGARAIRATRRRMVNVDFLLVYAIGIVVVAATIVTGVERGHDSIDSFTDALWWSVVTATTVGYGDMTPVTPVGRGMAVLLMLVGIGLFGGITANFASTIFRTDDNVEANTENLLSEVRALRGEVEALRNSVDALGRGEALPQAPQAGSETEPASRGFSFGAAANIIRGRVESASNLLRRGRRATDR